MKKYLIPALWFILLGASIYYGYEAITEIYKNASVEIVTLLTKCCISVFIAGMSVSALIFDFFYADTVTALNIYKRELEKESIDKTEGSSKIKVLESKIEVLEKALDEALKK